MRNNYFSNSIYNLFVSKKKKFTVFILNCEIDITSKKNYNLNFIFTVCFWQIIRNFCLIF